MNAFDQAVEAALSSLSRGDAKAAEGHIRQALAIRADDAEAISILGLSLVGAGGTRVAGFDALRRAVTLEPKEPRWHLHLAQSHSQCEQWNDAEVAYAKAAELSGGHPQILLEWARVLLAADRPSEAAQVFGQVLQKHPDPKIWLEAAEALTAARDTINAAYAFEQAYPPATRPDAVTAQLADMHIALGHYDKASAFNAVLIAKHPNDGDAGLRAANLLRWQGNIEAAKVLQATLWAKNPEHAGLAAAMLEDGQAGENGAVVDTAARISRGQNDGNRGESLDARRRCAFALCAYFDKAGEPAQAWEWAQMANGLYPDADTGLTSMREMLDKAIAAYVMLADSSKPAANTQMIYIIGPPRSGGSLLQTILARHQGARSVGERGALLSFLPDLLGDTDALAAQLDALAAADIAGMSRAVGQADYYIDKTPHYFLLAGLLSKVHKGARFIAPHRDPADIAVSLYFHEFGKEFAFTRDMAAIAEYLKFHAEAITRWRSAGVDIIDHNHDQFVENAADKAGQGQGEALCAALGLSWSADMLENSANDGVVRTFSARQVRGGVSKKYSGRGARYAEQLAASGFTY